MLCPFFATCVDGIPARWCSCPCRSLGLVPTGLAAFLLSMFGNHFRQRWKICREMLVRMRVGMDVRAVRSYMSSVKKEN